MSSTKAAAASKTADNKPIKPMKPAEFEPESVIYSSININNDTGTKWINTSYEKSDDKNHQFIVIAKNCSIISYKKMESTGKDGKPAGKSAYTTSKTGKPLKDKYQLFMKIKDEAFIEFVKAYQKSLAQVAHSNSASWFGSEMDESETTDMIRNLMSEHERYGFSLSALLTLDCKVTSKIDEISDTSNPEAVLIKNTIVNVAFNFNKIKLGVDNFRLGVEIKQVSITGIGSATPMESNAITPDKYEEGKLVLSPPETNDKNGKSCKVMYDGKLLRISFQNVVGRLFRMEDPEGKVTFSISIRLTDPEYRKMIETIDGEIFELLFKNAKEYYGSAKTKKQLKLSVKPICSYGKDDKVKIASGEKPTYEPSIWIKLFHNAEKGFDNKILNFATKKPIENADELTGKDLNIVDLEAYSRHIWFGPKGTSVNFTMNRCGISYDVPVFDMDDGKSGDDEEEAASGEEKKASEAENSSDNDE